MMGGKPVFERPAKSVINFDSGFAPKLLCDGATFSLGDACVYRCSFCYVPDMMRNARAKGGYLAHVPDEIEHAGFVGRRSGAIERLYEQLTTSAKGGKRKPKFDNENDNRVIYSSPLVDCAANMDLVRETVEACKLILELTNWQIRLLSKSNLLPKVALGLADYDSGNMASGYPSRVIYGVSTGTLDNKLASAFEEGCPLVSKRIESLHWLQDNGFRTFGMICPSLPQRDYDQWAWDMAQAIRADQCEHVWAEVMNVRGSNIEATAHCLRKAGYEWEANELTKVAADKDEWEAYARYTFLAHVGTDCYGENHTGDVHLRFLQYVTPQTRDWWRQFEESGAVLLGH